MTLLLLFKKEKVQSEEDTRERRRSFENRNNLRIKTWLGIVLQQLWLRKETTKRHRLRIVRQLELGMAKRYYKVLLKMVVISSLMTHHCRDKSGFTALVREEW